MQKKLQSDGGFPRQLKIKMQPISIKPSICKYHLYSSLCTHLNFNGDISLTFKPTLQVPQITLQSLQGSVSDVSASNHTAKRKHGDPVKRAHQHS